MRATYKEREQALRWMFSYAPTVPESPGQSRIFGFCPWSRKALLFVPEVGKTSMRWHVRTHSVSYHQGLGCVRSSNSDSASNLQTFGVCHAHAQRADKSYLHGKSLYHQYGIISLSSSFLFSCLLSCKPRAMKIIISYQSLEMKTEVFCRCEEFQECHVCRKYS